MSRSISRLESELHGAGVRVIELVWEVDVLRGVVEQLRQLALAPEPVRVRTIAILKGERHADSN